MLDQVRDGVARLDRAHGRQPDARSESMSYALLRLAKANGLTSVDHVVVSTEGPNVQRGEHVFVVQGGLSDPTNRVAHMKTADAMQAEPNNVLARVQAFDSVAGQTQHLAEQQRQAQVPHAHRIA